MFAGERGFRVLDAYAVDQEGVAEATVGESFAEALPDAVGVFLEFYRFVPGQVAGHGDRLGFRGIELEQNFSVRKYADGLKGIVGGGLPAPLGRQGKCAAQQDRDEQEPFHREFSCHFLYLRVRASLMTPDQFRP